MLFNFYEKKFPFLQSFAMRFLVLKAGVLPVKQAIV